MRKSLLLLSLAALLAAAPAALAGAFTVSGTLDYKSGCSWAVSRVEEKTKVTGCTWQGSPTTSLGSSRATYKQNTVETSSSAKSVGTLILDLSKGKLTLSLKGSIDWDAATGKGSWSVKGGTKKYKNATGSGSYTIGFGSNYDEAVTISLAGTVTA